MTRICEMICGLTEWNFVLRDRMQTFKLPFKMPQRIQITCATMTASYRLSGVLSH